MPKRINDHRTLIKNILLLVTGTGLAQLIPLLVSPILTRLYSPEDFGVLATFMGIVSVVSVIAAGRYELGMILPKRDSDVFNLLALSIIIALSVFLFSMIVALSYLKATDGELIYYFIPLAILFISLNTIQDKYNNKYKKYKVMSAQRIVKSIVEAMVSVSFVLVLDMETGMIFGVLGGYAISSLFMLYKNFNDYKLSAKYCKKKRMFFVAKKYIQFPKYSMPHALLNTLSSNLPIFLIPFFYGSSVLGFYAFGLKIVQAPLGLISNAVFNVLGQNMASVYADNGDLSNLVMAMFKKLFLLSTLLFPVIFFIDDAFSLIFGTEWRIAGDYIQLLSPWLFFIFLSAPFSTLPLIFNKQRKAYFIEIFSFLSKVISLLVCGYFFTIETTLLVLSTVSVLIISYSLFWYHQLINSKKVTTSTIKGMSEA